MIIQKNQSKVVLAHDHLCYITGGNLRNGWVNEALKILIAYWGSIKMGFSDGYNDFFEEQK
jgi:hypothetical protein